MLIAISEAIEPFGRRITESVTQDHCSDRPVTFQTRTLSLPLFGTHFLSCVA